MTFTDADDLTRRFIALDSGLGCVPAQRLTTSAGTRCTACGAVGTATWVRTKRLCLACRAPWRGEDVEVPRERIDGGDWRRTAAVLDDQLDMHRRLEPIVRRRPPGVDRTRWRYALLAYGAYVQPGGGSYERVAWWGQGAHPRLAWTPWRVRSAVSLARSWVERRARASGMIERMEVSA